MLTNLFLDLPRYKEFKRDAFNAISNYFCKGENFLDYIDLEKFTFTLFRAPPVEEQESMLSSKICCAFIKLSDLPHEKLVKTLQLCLLTLPPAKRRKLRVLVRFMAKVVKNSRLRDLDINLKTE